MTIWVKDELSFENLKEKCWSGAIDTLHTVEENHKEDNLMYLLDELSADNTMTLTQINDFLWFDDEYIFEMLEINTEEGGADDN